MEKTYLTCYTKKKGRGTPEFRFCFLSLCFLQFWKWLPVLKRVIGMKEDPLPTKDTIDQGNLTRGVIKSWDKSRLTVNHLMHDIWVVSFKT